MSSANASRSTSTTSSTRSPAALATRRPACGPLPRGCGGEAHLCSHEHGRARPPGQGATRRTGGRAGRRARRAPAARAGARRPPPAARPRSAGGPRPRPAPGDVELVAAHAELAEPAGRDEHAVLQRPDGPVVGARPLRSATGRAGRGGRPSCPAGRAGRGRARGSRGPCRPASAGSRRRRPCGAARSASSAWPARPACSAAYSSRRRLGLERRGQERLAGHEQHHELRRRGQRAPVGLGGQQCRRAGGAGGRAGAGGRRAASSGRRSTGGVEEGVERHLGVDHDVLAAGEVAPPGRDAAAPSLGASGAPARRSRSGRPARRARRRGAGAARPSGRGPAACAAPWTARRSRGGACRWSAARRRPAAGAGSARRRPCWAMSRSWSCSRSRLSRMTAASAARPLVCRRASRWRARRAGCAHVRTARRPPRRGAAPRAARRAARASYPGPCPRGCRGPPTVLGRGGGVCRVARGVGTRPLMSASATPRGLLFGTAAETYERFRLGYPDEVVDRTLPFAGRPVPRPSRSAPAPARRPARSPVAASTSPPSSRTATCSPCCSARPPGLPVTPVHQAFEAVRRTADRPGLRGGRRGTGPTRRPGGPRPPPCSTGGGVLSLFGSQLRSPTPARAGRQRRDRRPGGRQRLPSAGRGVRRRAGGPRTSRRPGCSATSRATSGARGRGVAAGVRRPPLDDLGLPAAPGRGPAGRPARRGPGWSRRRCASTPPSRLQLARPRLSRQSARSTITGAWSLAPLPARSSRSISRAGDPVRERGGAEHEVDPHPAVPLEALPVVVPVRVDLRTRVERTHDVCVAGVHDRLERRPLGWGDVGALRELRDVEDVLVARGDVPVAGERDLPLRGVREPAGGAPCAGPRARPACSRVRVAERPRRSARRATTPGPRCTWRRSPSPRRPAGRRTPACLEADARRPRGRPGRRSRRRSTGCARASRRRTPAPRGPSSATGRRAPWSPAVQVRRSRAAGTNASTRSIRERTEFTFQVAMRIRPTLRRAGRRAAGSTL